MAQETGKNPRARRLTGWKEIAAFVGRDERTLKRWEKWRGLPARRVPGAGHASVFAYTDEIEAWMRGPLAAEPTVASAVEASAQVPNMSVRLAHWVAPAAVLALFAIAAFFAVMIYRSQHSSPPTAVQNYVPDPVAAEFYRSGLHEWQTRTAPGLARAIADFKEAVAHDPHYAEAYAGLAEAYNLMSEFTATPPDQSYPKAIAAAKRAIALDPSLAAAHAALGFADFYWSRDVPAAKREFSRAIVLDPGSAVAHHWFATLLMTIGEVDEALAEIAKAQSLDSESSAILADKGLILYHAGWQKEAVALLKQLEDDQPLFASPHRYLAKIWLSAGNDQAYLRELKLTAVILHDGEGIALAEAGAKGFLLAGHTGMLRAILANEQKTYSAGRGSAYGLAKIYAELNDTQNTMKWLAISVARHEMDNIGLKNEPAFAAWRNDSRFLALLARAGLSAPVPLHG